MTDFYIRPGTSHSVSRDGRSYATAWGPGEDVGLGANDVLYLCGTFPTTFQIKWNGNVSGHFQYRGDAPEEAGQIIVTSGACLTGATTKDYVQYIGLVFSTSTTSDAVTLDTGSSFNDFIDCTFQNCGGRALRFKTTGECHVRGCSFLNNFGFGVYAANSPDLIIENCYFENNGGISTNDDSIGIDDGCINAIVRDCVVVGSNSIDGSGIDIQDSSLSGGKIQVLRCSVTGSEGTNYSATGGVGGPDVVFEGCQSSTGRIGYFVKGKNDVFIYNCNESDSTLNGIKAGGTTVDTGEIQLVVSNCIFETAGGATTIWYVDNGASSSLSINNSCYAGTPLFTRYETATNESFAAWQGAGYDADSVNSDPLLDGNLSPQDGSPCLGVGVKWWGNDARPSGYDGEPMPDTKIDVGSIQTTLDPGHPANL